jgi:predicted metal-dependent peptidase
VSDGPTIRYPNAEESEQKRQCRLAAEADRATLIVDFPFVGHLAMHLEIVPVVDVRIPTAATDGRYIWLNPQFMQSLGDDGRLFVLAHEVWHCALGHVGEDRCGDREPELWNVAVDHEVNAILVAEGLQMPVEGILFEHLTGWSAEEVYEELLAMREAGVRVEEADGSSAADPPEPTPPESPPERPEASARRGAHADVHGTPTELPPADEGPDEATDGAEPLVVDPDYRPAPPPPPEDWQERLVAVRQQITDVPGHLGALLDLRIRDLVAPRVNWRTVLRKFVTTVYGGRRRWLPPSRRHIARGLYLPSRREDAIQFVVAIDTSGSTGPFIGQFVSELVALVESFGRHEITLVCCDAEITAVSRHNADAPLTAASVELKGGGGTDLRPPFRWAEEHEPTASALLYLTDGYGPAPEVRPKLPTLWMLTPDGHPPASWGEICMLSDAEAD